MVYVLIVIGLIFMLVGCYLWVKFVYVILGKLSNVLFKNRKKEEPNPYIQAQKRIDLNNKLYEEYLLWMANNSSGVPLDKAMTKEEFEADKQINKLIK